MESREIAFVVLHYQVIEVTKKCVESILKLMNQQERENFIIIVVDNCSPNATGIELKKIYIHNKYVEVIQNTENLGFSKGNNIGYKKAKEKYQAEYIIVTNNDTEFIQKEFVDLMKEDFKKYAYYVLGPDIVNLCGISQSPQRDHIISNREIYIWYSKRYFYTRILKIQKSLGIKFKFIEKYYLNREEDRIRNFKTNELQENVELQGACIIFSPLYISKNDFAFEELAFMYTEEAALAYRCGRNNWKILYDPSLKIRHLEKASTNVLAEYNLDKEIFYSENNEKSLRALIKNIKRNARLLDRG